MKVPTHCLLVLLMAAAPAAAGVRENVDRALREIASPFLETRRRAVIALVSEGEAADGALRAAYPKADFRTKALVLDVYRRGRPVAGIPLVLGDLATPDRSVAIAQQRLLEAVYDLPAAWAVAEVVPLLPADYRLEEGIRALPGAGVTSRRALERIAASTDLRLRRAAVRLSALVEEVDRVRRRLASVTDGAPALRKERANELRRLLGKHDVERAILAVYEAGGDQGSYDGMYDLVGELVRPGEANAVRVLIRMVLTRTLPKPRPRRSVSGPPEVRRYEWSEPAPADLDEFDLFGLALSTLGDVAPPFYARDLSAHYFRLFQDGMTTSPMLNEYAEDGQETNAVRRYLAHACAALGDMAPLEDYVERLVEMRYMNGYLQATYLAAAYTRLGRTNEAVRQFREAVSYRGRDQIALYNLACAYARNGKRGEAIGALCAAVDEGYGLDPRQIDWMERDRDLGGIRESPRYRALLRGMRARLRLR